MSFEVRYTKSAKEDIFATERAYIKITKVTEFLKEFPFSCRKADKESPFLREVVIPFGVSGYVALFEIENNKIVTILAVRHQRENDYH